MNSIKKMGLIVITVSLFSGLFLFGCQLSPAEGPVSPESVVTQGSDATELTGKWVSPWVTDYAIERKWLSYNDPYMGDPTTKTAATPNKLGYYNHFQKGSIYHKTGASEAYVVFGMIRNLWANLGWENSSLGFPTTDELDTTLKDGRYNHFEGGSIYYSKVLNYAMEITGSIRTAWSYFGWEMSWLGYPKGPQWSESGKPNEQDFQNGKMFYKSSLTGLKTWPVLMKSQSAIRNGVSRYISTSRLTASQFGYAMKVVGRNFTPNTEVGIYTSMIYGPRLIGTITSDGSGYFSFVSDQLSTTDITLFYDGDDPYAQGIATVFAREKRGTTHDGYGAMNSIGWPSDFAVQKIITFSHILRAFID